LEKGELPEDDETLNCREKGKSSANGKIQEPSGGSPSDTVLVESCERWQKKRDIIGEK